MKNKKNIFVRIWRAIVCADFVEERLVAMKAQELDAQASLAAGYDDPMEDSRQVLSPSDDDTARVLGGSGHFIWRLYDEWPLEVIDGENKPKIALKMDARAFMFHVSTWALVTGRKQRNLCVSIRNMRDENFQSHHTGILLLPEGEEYDSFQIWWKAYVERFSLRYLNGAKTIDKYGNSEVHIFPEIPDSYSIEALPSSMKVWNTCLNRIFGIPVMTYLSSGAGLLKIVQVMFGSLISISYSKNHQTQYYSN